jgi:hypothetical protein
LGSFVQSLGLTAAVFAKFKAAGKALCENQPELYTSLLTAVADGTPRPRLPEVSKLALLPGLRRQGTTLADAPGVVLDRHTRVRDTRGMADNASYGSADLEGRATLQALDSSKVQLRKTEEVLKRVLAGQAGRMPPDLLQRRLGEVCEGCEAVLQLVMNVDKSV